MTHATTPQREFYLPLMQGCDIVGYMPARILPPTSELRRMVDSGMTHQEIADVVSRETGYPVSRSTVSAALHRAGASSPAKKYPDVLPWTIHEQHQTHYAARMLRLLGRRRRGITNSSESDARLDAWLDQLGKAEAVVTYVPETDDGFFYVRGKPVDGIPVARDVLQG